MIENFQFPAKMQYIRSIEKYTLSTFGLWKFSVYFFKYFFHASEKNTFLVLLRSTL